ncbi:hypothetical protein L596_001102 [Steinernema carpocapsae]|uniref:Granulins domain-containing protein n=1 Tax=Steinernema carpocapsae TaxID=34508 RepID=A0A4U8UKK8_STECR|nr:hypothetical protein L596_001102 [Steinernema carpocapsae]
MILDRINENKGITCHARFLHDVKLINTLKAAQTKKMLITSSVSLSEWNSLGNESTVRHSELNFLCSRPGFIAVDVRKPGYLTQPSACSLHSFSSAPSNNALFLLLASVATVLGQCPPNQTPCLGCVGLRTCCPFANAVCCRSGLRCCPAGSICSLNEQFCIRRNLAGREIRTPVASSSALFDDVLTANAPTN